MGVGSYALTCFSLSLSFCVFCRGGLSSDENRLVVSQFQPKKFENNWEDQIFNNNTNNNNNPPITTTKVPVVDHVKQELFEKSNDAVYVHSDHHEDQLQHQQEGHGSRSAAWSQYFMPASSPTSCITSLGSNNVLDFSHNKTNIVERNPKPDHSSEVRSQTAGFLNNNNN